MYINKIFFRFIAPAILGLSSLLFTNIMPVQAGSLIDAGYPFEPGTVWYVNGGYDTSWGHNDSNGEKYAFDFVRDAMWDANGTTANSNVLAIADGQLSVSSDIYRQGVYGGKVINLTLDDGSVFQYAHLTNIVRQNQRINKGQVIGTIWDGQPGGTNHLHLNRIASQPFDFNAIWSFPANGPLGSNGVWSGTRIEVPFMPLSIAQTNSQSVIQYADINNDGRTDMLISDNGGSYWITLSNSGVPTTLWSNSSFIKGQVNFTLGDFNGNGFTDMIAMTPTGTKWYLSNGNGTFYLAKERTDIRLGRALLTVGNFNGIDTDGKKRDDVILTNVDASHFYISQGDFADWDYTQPWLRTDWKINATNFTVLNLNGDEKSDLIVTLPQAQGGSYWLISDGTVTNWYGARSEAHLSYGNVEFTVGNFNGIDLDGKARDDIIITNADGSYFQVSAPSANSSGWSFTQTWARTDWKKGGVSFTPADLNGDGKSDLVITLPTAQGGTYVNLSNGTVNSWIGAIANRPDWSYGNVRFHTGNFNGVDADGKKRIDLILTTSDRSHWFYSNNNWGYTQNYVRDDYKLNQVDIKTR